MEKENITFLWAGRVSKARRILSENGSQKYLLKTGGFSRKTKGFLPKQEGWNLGADQVSTANL